MRFPFAVYSVLHFVSSDAVTCEVSLNYMMSDTNFVSLNTTLYETCYVQYQNDRYSGITGKTVCKPWEYAKFCADQIYGRSCTVFNDFLEMSLCVPSECDDSDLDLVNELIFQPNSKTVIDCSPSPVSPLIPVLVSTAVILALTAFLVFALRPPKHIRDERLAGKIKFIHLSSRYMGAALTYLSGEPVREVHVDTQSWPSGPVSAAAASMQGWRRSMEDAHFMRFDKKKNVHMFGVFDGHGGAGVARYSAKRLPELLEASETYQAGEFDVALHEAFLDLDLETQDPVVQEELFRLHMDSKLGTDARLVEIHLPFETLLDLFLGDPLTRRPPNPFRVFQDDYVLPNVFQLMDEVPAKRRREQLRFTAEPQSPWGAIASRIRSDDIAGVVASLRDLVDKVSDDSASNLLFRLKDEINWVDEEKVIKNPLEIIFEGSLLSAFHPTPGVPWSYSIHPIDLMSALNNNHMVEQGERCVSEDQGCTANVCLLVDRPDGGRTLYCGNAGDARAVAVLPRGEVLPLSIDHKPSLPGERRRVLYAGGRVIGRADPRVQGDLNLSRAIGDWRHKQNTELPLELQMISPRPDITVTEFSRAANDSKMFIVLGCDGIWERFSSADCGEFVDRNARKNMLGDTCKAICEATVRGDTEFPGSPIGVTIGCDNMTVILVEVDGVAASAGGDTMPVISYGAQVPDEWNPVKRTRKGAKSASKTTPVSPAVGATLSCAKTTPVSPSSGSTPASLPSLKNPTSPFQSPLKGPVSPKGDSSSPRVV